MPLRIFANLVALLITMSACGFAKPTVFIIGDSTVRNSTADQMGWGDPLVAHFDPAKANVINRAIGGRSSRTFITEGRWAAVKAHLKQGDYVLIQFGHNDGGALNDERCRASLRGTGEETEDIIRKTDSKPETVLSFGAYLRTYINETRSKGAVPVIISPIPRNIWKNGSINRSKDGHAKWALEIAAETGTLCVDFHNLLSDQYDLLGETETTALFAKEDHTHTGPDGAEFNARWMASALRSLSDKTLAGLLLPLELFVPSIFSNHMVLQQGVPVPVWGYAKPGAKVEVQLASQKATVTADASGKWETELPAISAKQQAAEGPYEMRVSSSGVTRVYQDILVGEVWLCSGQSNMDFTLASTAKRSFSGVTDWQKEVAAANHPSIRMFTAEWTMREMPQRDVEGRWLNCSPETAGDFSAAAYYFARKLQKELNTPIGLITSAYGASTIEAWIREGTLQPHPQFEKLLQEFSRKRTAFRDAPKQFEDYGIALAKFTKGRPPRNPDPAQDQHNPYVLHNGMIAPIAPYAIRGAIWYQGESNLGTRGIYPDLQKALIEDWRALWNNPKLPFYYVQLAAYKNPSSDPAPGGQIAEMREAQATSLAIPHTGMAVTIDIGDAKDIHPRNKLDVGERLARLALAGIYAKPGVPSGPVLRDASPQKDSIRIHFDHVNGGLVSKTPQLGGFAIAAADRKFVTADAVIDGDSVVVSSPAVTQPVHVRYAWADNPATASLFNAEGLPAAPFRTDPR